MVLAGGFEPPTLALSARCSSPELRKYLAEVVGYAPHAYCFRDSRSTIKLNFNSGFSG